FMLEDFSRQFMRVAKISRVNPREDLKIRVTRAIQEEPLWREECERILQGMAAELSEFVDLNKNLAADFEDFEDEIAMALTNPLLEWQALIGRLDGLRKTILSFMSDNTNVCRWVELAQRSGTRD